MSLAVCLLSHHCEMSIVTDTGQYLMNSSSSGSLKTGWVRCWVQELWSVELLLLILLTLPSAPETYLSPRLE